MNKIVVTEEDQLILIVRHFYQHRPNKEWEGCLEVEQGINYTMPDILKLANDEPDTIQKVFVISGRVLVDITDDVLDFAGVE